MLVALLTVCDLQHVASGLQRGRQGPVGCKKYSESACICEPIICMECADCPSRESRVSLRIDTTVYATPALAPGSADGRACAFKVGVSSPAARGVQREFVPAQEIQWNSVMFKIGSIAASQKHLRESIHVRKECK